MTVPQHLRLGLVLAAATCAYVVLGLVGRLTILPGDVLALVWPAAGAAVVVVGLLPTRWWPPALVSLAAATVVVNIVSNPFAVAAAFVVPNTVQGLVGAAILRRTAPHLVVGGGTLALQTFQDYVRLIFAAVASSLAAVVCGTVALSAVGRGTWGLDGLVVWTGRNTVGALVVLTLAALLIGRREEREPDLAVDAAPEQHGVELALLTTVSAVLYLVVFTDRVSVPLAFPLLVPTVWAGLRFGLALVTLHSLAAAVVVVVATVRSAGPFAAIASGHEQALLTQTYIGMVFVVGVLLALASGERRLLARTLRQAHAAASNHAALLGTVIESMREGVTVLDAKGQVQLQNQAADALLRRRTGSGGDVTTMAMEVRDLADRELPLEHWPYSRALRGEDVVASELRLYFGEGLPERDLSVSARRLPFATEAGEDQVVVIYHDVTNERAQRTALESFARTVAHDLKGPLGIVEGWAELLDGEARARELLASPEVASSTGRILGAASTMRTLIGDLLERSLSRDQEPRLEVVDLQAMAQEVADQHRSVSSGTPPRVEVRAVPPVSADPAMVRQVLHNLIGNACKYVAPGEVAEVEVRGRVVGEMVEVVVADRGIGIPDGEHERVFAVFNRAHPRAAYEGQGIGLSVCKTIVGRHGGTIRARARTAGPGTAFVMTLPAAAPLDAGVVVGGRG